MEHDRYIKTRIEDLQCDISYVKESIPKCEKKIKKMKAKHLKASNDDKKYIELVIDKEKKEIINLNRGLKKAKNELRNITHQPLESYNE